MDDKVQLYSEELEYKVLSNLMNYPALFGEYGEVLSPKLFYFPKCQTIFNAIKDVRESGDVPDLLTVDMWIMGHPSEFAPDHAGLATVYGYAVTSVNFGKNVMMLAEMAKRRRCWLLGQKMIKAGTDFTVDIGEIDKELDEYREESLQAASDYYDMRAANETLKKRIEDNFKDERANMVPTGFKYIDDKGGFQLTDFNVIGGSTSQGKTTLAVNMLVNAAKSGVPGMMFTLEMTVPQLAARINAPLCGIPSSVMLFKKLHSSQIENYSRASATTDSLPIYIDDTSTNYETIKEKIRSMAIKRKVKIFFIDYIQVLSTTLRGGDSESRFFETISREFKNLAKELNVCIVALSQLNRQVNDADPRPSISKLKASSGIEQAADNVIMPYRPGYYGKRHRYRPELDPDTTVELIIGKGRHVGTGSTYVGFKAEFSQFYDLDAGERQDVQPSQPTQQAEQQILPF